MTVMEKVGAGKHPAPLGCAAVDADSMPSKAPGRSRWLTAVVLAVVAGFFVATLAARWNDVISVKWRLDPWLFAAATVLLALSYGLVALLWGLALHRSAGTRASAGARVWFLSNLARYVPGNIWSYVGAVELARREGVARRVTLAVMALTQVLSVGVAVAAGLDRKSTRLNSSHQIISYAVFCLKKKKKNTLSYSLRKKKKQTKQ